MMNYRCQKSQEHIPRHPNALVSQHTFRAQREGGKAQCHSCKTSSGGLVGCWEFQRELWSCKEARGEAWTSKVFSREWAEAEQRDCDKHHGEGGTSGGVGPMESKP